MFVDWLISSSFGQRNRSTKWKLIGTQAVVENWWPAGLRVVHGMTFPLGLLAVCFAEKQKHFWAREQIEGQCEEFMGS
jgi:hypothetical protein